MMRVSSIGTGIYYSAATVESLNTLGQFNHHEMFPDEESLIVVGAQSDILITWGKVTRRFLQCCQHLKIVVLLSTGEDECFEDENVYQAAYRSTIKFYNTPLAATIPVAEYCVAAGLSALRRLVGSRPSSITDWKIKEFSEVSAGIIGTGPIGLKVAEYFSRLGMKVACSSFRENPSNNCSVEKMSIERNFACADIIVICLRLVPATRGIIGASLLDSMKSDVILVNAARPEITCLTALKDFLGRNPKASLVIDAETERICGLSEFPNCTYTPHIAFFSEAALYRYTDIACAQIFDFLRPQHGREE